MTFDIYKSTSRAGSEAFVTLFTGVFNVKVGREDMFHSTARVFVNICAVFAAIFRN